MKNRFLHALTIAPLFALLFSSCSEPGGTDEVEILFNGKDLAGWTGNPANWKVVDGVITGTTTDENPLPYNQFLIWDGDPIEDFELTAELKLTSDGNNSGIQYRAAVRPDLGENVVAGYQCDMHPALWANGMLYDEKGRGILCTRGTRGVAPAEGKPKVVGKLTDQTAFNTGEWNTYRIVAKGNHLVHEINGIQTVDFYDHDEENRDLSGVIAFQIHKGPAMTVEIRNITLKRLPGAELTAPEATPIPEGAADAGPPRPAGKGKAKEGPKSKGKAPAKAKDAPKTKAPGKSNP